jgi:uncharacterized LabA/DUF88 family protein
MFNPKTPRVKALANIYPTGIKELDGLFGKSTIIYIDWQNVLHTQEKVGFNFDARRVKQFFDSFPQITNVRIYNGTLNGNQQSIDQIQQFKDWGYDAITKPVKIMPLFIDVSSIPMDSPTILKSFIKKSLLNKLKVETVKALNGNLKELNQAGITWLEEQKCNFDVEIGRDMLSDFTKGGSETFVLWSGDSDFWSPIKQLIGDGKKVFILSTARRVSSEIDSLGVPIFDVKKIKEFLCWPSQLSPALKAKIDSSLPL